MPSRRSYVMVAITAGTLLLGYCSFLESKSRRRPEKKGAAEARRPRIQDDGDSEEDGDDPERLLRLETFSSQCSLTVPEDKIFDFIQGIGLRYELGMELINEGDVSRGAEHLAIVAVHYDDPDEIFDKYKTVLPAAVYQATVNKFLTMVSSADRH